MARQWAAGREKSCRGPERILRFVDIRADAGSGSAELIADDRFVSALKIFDKIQDFDGENSRYFNKFVVRFLYVGGFFRLVIYHWRSRIANGGTLIFPFLSP